MQAGRKISVLGILALAICAVISPARAQEGATPQGADRDSIVPTEPPADSLPAQSAPVAADDSVTTSPQSVSFEIIEEPDGEYVSLSGFLELLQTIDPKAQGEWDGQLRLVRIDALGHKLQALASRPAVLVDTTYRSAPKPVRFKDGAALLPMTTVAVLFEALGIAFDLEGAPPPERPPDGAGPLLFAASDPFDRSQQGPSGPEFQMPERLEEVEGLTWGQLADYAHRSPPRRLLFVCEPELLALAQKSGAYISRATDLDFDALVLERHPDAELLERIAGSGADLLIQLLKNRGGDTQQPGGFEVWAVHEALWPAPPALEPGQTSRSENSPGQDLYQVHQFHNLAFGSMLRREVAKAFPGVRTRYTLGPLYLLRRVDMPSAAVLVPQGIAPGESPDFDRTARAIAGGVVGYYLGMQGATRR